MRRTPLIPVAVAAMSLLATAFAPAANAATDPDVVADGLVSALSVAVADDGTVYASQNFASLITKIAPGGEPEVIYADEGHREVGAFSVDGDVLTFGASIPGVDVKMYTYEFDGEGYVQTQIADLWAYEKAHNPDHANTYGIAGLSKSCTKATPKGWRPYKGRKDSHAYASTTLDGITYVADAGANAIIAIDGDVVSTVAVLPPTSIKITKSIRKVLGAPKCTIGKKLRVEGVPTDVEAGPDGNLYVTSLPGGPEDPAMGANGAVYRVDLGLGKISKLSGGLATPTGIAIGPDGTAYVSMLFASVVLAIPFGGEPFPFAEVPFPGDVDVKDGAVYVTESGLNDPEEGPYTGKVLKFTLAEG
jgi:hypothetical protein